MSIRFKTMLIVAGMLASLYVSDVLFIYTEQIEYD